VFPHECEAVQASAEGAVSDGGPTYCFSTRSIVQLAVSDFLAQGFHAKNIGNTIEIQVNSKNKTKTGVYVSVTPPKQIYTL